MFNDSRADAFEANARIVRAYRPIEDLIPAQWKQGTVEANGIAQYYYRTGGVKPPLVLLHGILEGALAWLRTARVLARDFDVIMLDARGHGNSARINSGRIKGMYSQELLNADAAGAIRALAAAPVHLLGLSQGAITAVHVAAEHPDLVRSLVAAGWSDGSGGIAGDVANAPGYVAWLKTYVEWLEALKAQTHQERMLSALSQTMPGAPRLSEDDYVAWVENCARLDLELPRMSGVLWSQVGKVSEQAEQALAQVSCPTLMIKSGMFPSPGAAVRVEREPSTQPNIEIVRFVNAGHLIHQHEFELFVSVVKKFLDNQDAGNARIQSAAP